MATGNLDRQVEERLRSAQVRYTRGRRTVVTALARAEGPLAASELNGKLESVPLSSLYRSLAVLEEAGVVSPHFSKQGVTRYELAEWLRGHHHHLVCTDCGAIEDVSLSTALEGQVHNVVDEIGRVASFQPTGHALEIEGRCARCA